MRAQRKLQTRSKVDGERMSEDVVWSVAQSFEGRKLACQEGKLAEGRSCPIEPFFWH